MGPQLPRQGGPGCDDIQLSESLKPSENDPGFFSDPAGQVTKNPQHFSIDLTIGDLDRVVEIHEFPRLQKDRSSAGRHIVHNAGDAPLHIDLDGHNVPAFALRKVAFLKHLLIAARMQDVFEAMADLLFEIIGVLREPAKLRRSRIPD
jgi:hypothetical protein